MLNAFDQSHILACSCIISKQKFGHFWRMRQSEKCGRRESREKLASFNKTSFLPFAFSKLMRDCHRFFFSNEPTIEVYMFYTHPFDIFEDEVQFASSSERLSQIDNVLLFEWSQQLELAQGRALHIFVIYINGNKDIKFRKCVMSYVLGSPPPPL